MQLTLHQVLSSLDALWFRITCSVFPSVWCMSLCEVANYSNSMFP